ncbi:type II secretion system protein [Sporosarcina cascadiensis]|uniref:type II secretion system protein n=1 Tax=Sporosarcina cascadiensis TaxID=2660747 RepID=UPI0018919F1A|nr:prepilin-type N-terminal cleavage/methylation domain-containing protein [Sporosarcina cascadiensis]
MKKRIKGSDGLTLIELLAVIVILGIIAAIAVPAIANIIENSKIKVEKANAVSIIEAAELYFVDYEDPTGYIKSVSVPTLIAEGFLEDEGLGNNSLFVADSKPAWICGNADAGKNKILFKKATRKMIENSGKELVVGSTPCGHMEGAE